MMMMRERESVAFVCGHDSTALPPRALAYLMTVTWREPHPLLAKREREREK